MPQAGPGFLQPLHPQEKLKQRAAAAVLHLTGQGVEGEKIALPLSSPLHSAKNAQQIGLFKDVPHELAAGAVPRAEAQLLQTVQKVPALPVPPLCGLDQRRVKVPIALRPQEGQLVPGKAVHRGAQCGDEGHILAGVVHNLEDCQGHIDLGGLKEIAVPFGVPGNPLLIEGLKVVVEHRTRAAEKDHHIRGPQGPKSLPLLHHQGHIQQRPDPPGSEPGLQEVFVVPLPLLIPQKG